MTLQKTPKKNNKSGQFRHGFKTFAEKTANEYRKALGLKSHDFLCAFKLCEYLKIPVLTPKDIKNLEDNHLNNLLGIGSEFWSAVTIPVDDHNQVIIYNPNHSKARQQSDLMHEIAHVTCKHKSPDTPLYDLPPALRTYNVEQEEEAIWLGGCLQLPRDLLLYHLRQGSSIQTIGNLNSASVDMVQYRINVTGVSRQIRFIKRQ